MPGFIELKNIKKDEKTLSDNIDGVFAAGTHKDKIRVTSV